MGREGSRTSKFGKRLGKLVKMQTCRGCGRLLPKGSWVMIWSVWIDRRRERMRLCSDCQEVIYACDCRRPLNHQKDPMIVRDMCECCDGFPNCERVEYLKESKPGEIFFGDLQIGEE